MIKILYQHENKSSTRFKDNKDPRRYSKLCGTNSVGVVGEFSNKLIAASVLGTDFSNGHRGYAKAIRGMKKFVRTRTRFHENAATKKLAELVIL